MKQNCIKNNDIIRKDLEYKIQQGKQGECTIYNNEFAGYCIVNKSRIIGPLYVEKEFRGYGLGELLFKDIINKYGGNQLGVYSDNEIAIKLYKKYGFEIYSKTYKDGDIVYLMKLKSDRV